MSSQPDEPRSTPFSAMESRVVALGDKKRMGDGLRACRRSTTSAATPLVGFTDVWLWDDWPDRMRLGLKADQGIDIVAIDGEGRRVAIQVKFHSDPDRDVTQREVATLFSFRPDLFDRWVIVSNAIGHSRQRRAGHRRPRRCHLGPPRCPRGQHHRLERCPRGRQRQGRAADRTPAAPANPNRSRPSPTRWPLWRSTSGSSSSWPAAPARPSSPAGSPRPARTDSSSSSCRRCCCSSSSAPSGASRPPTTSSTSASAPTPT